MTQKIKPLKCYIRQDESITTDLQAHHFDTAYWEDKPGFMRIEGGRGGSIKISLDGQTAMLRQYLRGGLISYCLTDQYWWLGQHKTRPWQEWSVLQQAHAAGLPVPKPLGFCFWRSRFFYRAAIMTDFFEGTQTLAARLMQGRLSKESWLQLGRLLRRFQLQGFRHADLNANNILVDNQAQFFIIDFDRAKIMENLGDWQWKPLYRLLQSLKKINRTHDLHYTDSDWQIFMDGYQAPS